MFWCGLCVGRVDSWGWKRENSRCYQSIAGGYSCSTEQGAAGRSTSDGVSRTSMLRPHPGSLHDGSGDDVLAVCVHREHRVQSLLCCVLVAETWTSPDRTTLPAQHFRSSDLLCCWSDGLELATGQSPRPGAHQQQLQTVENEPILSLVLSTHSAVEMLHDSALYYWHAGLVGMCYMTRPAESQRGPRGRPHSGPLHIPSLFLFLSLPSLSLLLLPPPPLPPLLFLSSHPLSLCSPIPFPSLFFFSSLPLEVGPLNPARRSWGAL